MKKVYFLILICLQGLTTQSQTPASLNAPAPDQKEKSAHRKGFSLEPLVGIGTSEAVQNGTNNLGWKAGCSLVYMFNDHWGISSGLQVQRYSTKVISGKDTEYVNNAPPAGFLAINFVSTNYNFIYSELPVMVRYVSSQNKKIGIFSEAGFIFGYLITSSEWGTIYETDIYSPNFIPPTSSYTSPFNPVTPNATSFNLQGHLALGVVIPISKRCSIIIDISINQGFTCVGNSSNDFKNFNSPFYYYKNNNNYSPSISSYSTNFSGLLSVRLNINL